MIATTDVKAAKAAKASYGAFPESTAEETVKKWIPLVKRLIVKYPVFDLDYDEQFSLGIIAVWEAFKRFDPGRDVKFITYVYNTVAYRFRSEKKLSQTVFKRMIIKTTVMFSTLSSGSDIRDSWESNNIVGPSIARPSLLQALDGLTSYEKFIAGKTSDGYNMREIAVMLDISRARVHQILEGIRVILRDPDIRVTNRRKRKFLHPRTGTRYTTKQKRSVPCPFCEAGVGESCTSKRYHPERCHLLTETVFNADYNPDE